MIERRAIPDEPRVDRRREQLGEAARLRSRLLPQAVEARDAFLELDAPLQRAALIRVQRATHRHGVLAFHAMAGMEHRVRPRPVVGEQDQALAVLVEPAHRIEPGVAGEIARDDLDDGARGMPIARGGGHAGRLVQDDVDETRRGGAQRPAIHDDGLCGRVDLLAQLGRSAVDGDPSRRDELIRTAPGGDSRRGEHLRDALRRHQPAGSVASSSAPAEPAAIAMPSPPSSAAAPPRPHRAAAAPRGGEPEALQEVEAGAVEDGPPRRFDRPSSVTRRRWSRRAPCSPSRRPGSVRWPPWSRAGDTRRWPASRERRARAARHPRPRTAR